MYSDKIVERGRDQCADPCFWTFFLSPTAGVHGCFALSTQDRTLDRLILTINMWDDGRLRCARAPILLAPVVRPA